MDWFRGEQLFYRAIRALVGVGDMPDRVISAANELLNLNADDVPEEIRAKLGTVLFGGQEVPKGQWTSESGQIERLVRTLSSDELILIAPQILDLYLELLAAQPAPPPNPLEAVVPEG